MKMIMKSQPGKLQLKETTLRLKTCIEMMSKFPSVLKDMKMGKWSAGSFKAFGDAMTFMGFL